MKKILLTSVCVLGMAGIAFGQGKITWASISASAMTAQTNGTQYSPLTGGGSTGGGTVGATAIGAQGFYYQLLTSADNVPVTGPGVAKPTTTNGLASWTAIAGATGNNSTTSAGRLVPITATTALTVPWAAGATQNLMLVGWSANLGNNWATVLGKLINWAADYQANSYFGMSNTGYIAAGGADPGTAVFGTSASAFGLPINSLNTQLYLLSPVPEPSTLALAGLGGLALLALRRRK